MPRIYPKNGTKFNRGCKVCGCGFTAVYPDENIELTHHTQINEGLKVQRLFGSCTVIKETVSKYTAIDAVCPNCGHRSSIGIERELGSVALPYEDWV